jgi:hypothetical protein
LTAELDSQKIVEADLDSLHVQRILEVGFVFIFIVDTRKKKQILKTLDSLDKKVETMLLDANEIGLKHYLNNRLVALLRERGSEMVPKSKCEGTFRRRF